MNTPYLISVAIAVALTSVGNANPHTTELVAAARTQIGITVSYDPSYQSLDYPGGDVATDKGVCTDVVIRAFRKSYNLDLQKAVHEDMKSNFSKYPGIWGLKSTDRNIDHRRVPNLQTYFKRAGYSLPVTKNAADYHPGDLVTCIVPPNLPHIMIVSNRKNSDGVPLVIHNIGRGTLEENRLFEFKLVGHYRIPRRSEQGGGGQPATRSESK
jgi:uncharacterized protein YijF (DUF1287 family)